MKHLLLLVLLCTTCPVRAQTVAEPSTKDHPEWSQPYPPFRIAGNLYYVGTKDLACYLITTPKGHILINTGLASSAPLIRKSIETLGFRMSDVKILLTTQAHFDHMGGMAAIKKMTHARLMIDAGDSAVAADGGRSDYFFGGPVCVFTPVAVDRTLHNGDTVQLGGMQLIMLHHPGHTKGSCSYLFTVKDNKRSYRVLIANMPSIITEKNFSDIPAYPAIQQDYAYTLKAMKQIQFDIWLSSHGTQFHLLEKHKPHSPYDPSAFMDKAGYYSELNALQQDYNKKISKH